MWIIDLTELVGREEPNTMINLDLTTKSDLANTINGVGSDQVTPEELDALSAEGMPVDENGMVNAVKLAAWLLSAEPKQQQLDGSDETSTD